MKRFTDKIKIVESGCWEWQAGGRGNGYGSIKVNGKVVDAHVFSYQYHIGDIPKGFMVCHNCDNRKCVNPEHLFLGTGKDNYEDAVEKGRIIKPQKGALQDKKHPSSSAYTAGCRCDKCKKYKIEYMQEWRKKKALLRSQKAIR